VYTEGCIFKSFGRIVVKQSGELNREFLIIID
jgi:hypothetical protein